MALGLYRNPKSRPCSRISLLPQTPTIRRYSRTRIHHASVSESQNLLRQSHRNSRPPRMSNRGMDVLRRSPKRRNWIEPRDRPRDRCHLEHTSRHHIMPDTGRGNETQGSETSRQASFDRGSRGTKPERAQRGQTGTLRCRASRRVSQRARTLQKIRRLRNQKRGLTVDCKRRLRAGRIPHDTRCSKGHTLVEERMKALTSRNFVSPVPCLHDIRSLLHARVRSEEH